MTTATEQARQATMVVRPDRGAARSQLMVLSTVACSLVIVNVLGAARSDGWGATFHAAAVLAWVAVLAIPCAELARLSAVDAVAEIGPDGVRVNDLGRGWVALSWDAVGSVRKDIWGRIVVKPAAGVDELTPGTSWPDDGAARRAARTGVRFTPRSTTADADQVMAAVAHLSGGRFPA